MEGKGCGYTYIEGRSGYEAGTGKRRVIYEIVEWERDKNG